MDWKRTLQWSFAWLLLGGAALAQDSDNDGIPDAWEIANYMNPDWAYDAAVDFDRDGLTSLQEYQLSLLGKGSGSKGKWSATLVNLNETGDATGGWSVVAINDKDDVLVNVINEEPFLTSAAWIRKGSDGTWRHISTVNGGSARITGRDLNNEGQVAGEAIATGVNGGNSFGFIKDLNALPTDTNVAPWYSETDSVTPVRSIKAINNWGDVIGARADWTSFFQSSLYGDVSPPGTWNSTYFTALNDWGQVTGIEMTDPNYGMDLWSHFLLSEGWESYIPFPGFMMGEFSLPDDSEEWEVGGMSHTPSLINDWGEYAGKFTYQEEEWEGYWFYDGKPSPHGAPPYRQLLYPHQEQVIHALNNWPQVIVSGTRPPYPHEPEDYYPHEAYLWAGGITIPLTVIAPDPTVITSESFTVIGINNRSTILARVDQRIYLLKLNQDADDDRIPDDWEEFYGMDPLDPSDALEDDDEDGASNLSEFQFGGNPTDDEIEETLVDGELRDRLDTDADGLPDAWERKFFPNLTLVQVSVTDDADYDYLSNGKEWQLGTDPTKKDTDRDGLIDGDEIDFYFTNPANPDSDGDDLVDGDELDTDKDPLDPNSTGPPPTFLRIAEKATAYDPTVHDDRVWVNWRHDIKPVLHSMKEDPQEEPDYPTYAQVLGSHNSFPYKSFSEQDPFTINYPGGTWRYDSEGLDDYNSDAFYGEGNPVISFDEYAPEGGFRFRSWKVRAERKTAHGSAVIQNWLLVELDETYTIQNIKALQFEIVAGEKVSEPKEIKPSGNGRLVRAVPVAVAELSPKVKDEDGNEIEGSDMPNVGNLLTPFVEVNPHIDRIAHRELKVKTDASLEGKTVTWTMESLLPSLVPNAPSEFRGQWADASPAHQHYFEASAAYGPHEFVGLPPGSATTIIDGGGFTSIRVNIPPIGFNQARIRVKIEGMDEPVDLIDMEVPGVVVIDPGHGGLDSGAVGAGGVQEKDLALAYALNLRERTIAKFKAENHQLNVLMTRATTDEFPTLAARPHLANQKGADVFVSIHFNSNPNASVRGTETYVERLLGESSAGNPGDNKNIEEDELLALVLNGSTLSAVAGSDMGAINRGVLRAGKAVTRDGPGYNGNTQDYHPIRACLIEVEFLSNETALEVIKLTNPSGAAIKNAFSDNAAINIFGNIRSQP